MALSWLFALSIVLVPFLFLSYLMRPFTAGANGAVRALGLMYVVSITLTVAFLVGWL